MDIFSRFIMYMYYVPLTHNSDRRQGGNVDCEVYVHVDVMCTNESVNWTTKKEEMEKEKKKGA